MRFYRATPATLFVALCFIAAATRLCAQSGAPTLSVDIGTARTPISPDIYGIANYGLDATFAQQPSVSIAPAAAGLAAVGGWTWSW